MLYLFIFSDMNLVFVWPKHHLFHVIIPMKGLPTNWQKKKKKAAQIIKR